MDEPSRAPAEGAWAAAAPRAGARRAASARTEPTADSGSWRAARARGRAWVPLVILVGGLVLLLYSMQLGSMTTSGYDLQRLQSEGNEWRQRNEQLQLEIAKVQSLAWIEVEAQRRLGMEKATRVTFLEVAPPADAAEAGESATEPAQAKSGSGGGSLDVLALWRGLLAHIMPPIDAGP